MQNILRAVITCALAFCFVCATVPLYIKSASAENANHSGVSTVEEQSSVATIDGDILLGSFWVNEDDWSDVIYCSTDGTNFYELSCAFTDPDGGHIFSVADGNEHWCMREPSIIYYNGYFWLLSSGGINLDNGRANFVISYSSDLITWSIPWGFTCDIDQSQTPLGNNQVAPEWYLDSNTNELYILQSMGYFGTANGQTASDDNMQPYMVKINSMTVDGDPWVNSLGMYIPNEIQVNFGTMQRIDRVVEVEAQGTKDNLIDACAYYDSGKYYYVVKNKGNWNDIFVSSSMNASANWSRVNDEPISYGFEGPSLTKFNGLFQCYMDGVLGTEYTGVKKITSENINDGWSDVQNVNFYRADGTPTTARHGSVFTLKQGSEGWQKVVNFMQEQGLIDGDKVERLAGGEAADTAAAIVQETYPESGSSEWAILARDDDFADAMSATGLAGTLNAPIVLTNRYGLSTAAKEQLQRLGVKNAYVIGGSGAMPGDFLTELKQAGVSGSVTRIYGANSWDTSVACANKINHHNGNPQGYAVIATSENFQDALSISSFAYKYKVPIFLSACENGKTYLTNRTKEAVKKTSGTIFVPGGPGALSSGIVENIFQPLGREVIRIYGETGYDTSCAVAQYMTTHTNAQGSTFLSTSVVCVASGTESAKGVDALAGSVLAGKAGGVMLLSNGQIRLEPLNYITLDNFLIPNKTTVSKVYKLGGEFVMPQITIGKKLNMAFDF